MSKLTPQHWASLEELKTLLLERQKILFALEPENFFFIDMFEGLRHRKV